VCGSFLLTCRFNGADDGRNLLLSPEPHHFQLGGAGLAFLGIPKFFFVFLGEEQRNTGWFIWSKSACYSPARAYVYSMGMNIHQPAAFSQFHHIQQQRRGWRTSQFTRVKEYEAMVGDLRFISVTPCLPFFFHPPFQKRTNELYNSFFTRVQRCLLLSERHPSAGEIYRRRYL
jgi:hypothetical protein